MLKMFFQYVYILVFSSEPGNCTCNLMLWKNDKKIAAMKKINIKILFQNLNQRNKVTFWKNIYIALILID